MAPRRLRWRLRKPTAGLEDRSSDDKRSSERLKRRRTQTRSTEERGDAGDEEDDGEPTAVGVKLVELIGEVTDGPPTSQQHYGLFMWPSALVLAHYVAAERRSIHGKVVLELGCGTGLPGILAALCGRPKKVYLTDRHDAVDTKRNVEANIRLNGLDGVAAFLALNWGDVCDLERLDRVLETVDLILAADCFYNTPDFEKVLATVALVFRCNPQSRFVTTYQLRSLSRSIAPLLSRWGMSARVIDKRSFLPLDEHEDGEVTAFESVFTYEIRPAREGPDRV